MSHQTPVNTFRVDQTFMPGGSRPRLLEEAGVELLGIGPRKRLELREGGDDPLSLIRPAPLLVLVAERRVPGGDEGRGDGDLRVHARTERHVVVPGPVRELHLVLEREPPTRPHAPVRPRGGWERLNPRNWRLG
jgi:hypothetical protein